MTKEAQAVAAWRKWRDASGIAARNLTYQDAASAGFNAGYLAAAEETERLRADLEKISKLKPDHAQLCSAIAGIALLRRLDNIMKVPIKIDFTFNALSFEDRAMAMMKERGWQIITDLEGDQWEYKVKGRMIDYTFRARLLFYKDGQRATKEDWQAEMSECCRVLSTFSV